MGGWVGSAQNCLSFRELPHIGSKELLASNGTVRGTFSPLASNPEDEAGSCKSYHLGVVAIACVCERHNTVAVPSILFWVS